MASSYASLFGTNGAAKRAVPTPDDDPTKPKTQTFSQMQQAGQARPAPPTAAPAPSQAAPASAPSPYSGMLGQLQQQLQQSINQPSGYNTEQFQQLRQQGRADLEAQYAGQQQQLDEELARRGLSASSIGAGRMGDLAGQQSRALAGLESQLLQQQAELTQRGRENTLGTLAEVTGQLGQQQLGERELGQRGEQFGLQLNEQQSARLQQYGISQQELGLRAQQLQQEASLQGRSLNIQEAQNLAQNELEGRKISQQNEQFTQNLSAEDRRFAQTLDEQRANRLQTLGISNTELEQRARQISQQDRSLSLQEARDAAEVDFRAESLVQQAALEGNRITLDTARFEAERDFRVDQLAQQQDQFTATLSNEEQRFVRTLAEQQAGRIQQLGLSTRELDQRATQIADDARLRGETLSLQQARDEAEIEARANAIASQEAMQGRQITADEARQTALLGFQRDQSALDEAFRKEGIAVDRERLSANERQFTEDLALRTASLAQQETQFAANLGLDQQRMGLDQQRFQLQLAAALAPMTAAQRNQFFANFNKPKEEPKDVPIGQTTGDGGGPPGTNLDLDFGDLQRQIAEFFKANPITYG